MDVNMINIIKYENNLGFESYVIIKILNEYFMI